MTVPIKPWMIHQNRESAPDQEQQKKEIHKMSQSQPGGESTRTRRMFQIDWRQERFRGKPVDQILPPGNQHGGQSENGKSKDKPGVYPNPETAIRWIVDRSMNFVKCLHKQSASGVNQ